MRYVVLGAGAVGGTIGARLAAAGHEVTLLARGTHAAAMRDQGLRLATPDGAWTVHPLVVERPADLSLRSGDVLFVTCKSNDTSALLGEVAAAGPDLPVFCVQNGITNERAALRRFHDVYGVVVMLPAVWVEPGRVEAQGTPHLGLLDLGRYPTGVDDSARRVSADLDACGFVSRAVPNVMPWKAAKLLRNLGNAVEALCGHAKDPSSSRARREVAARLRHEAEAVLELAGVAWVADDEWERRRGGSVELGRVDGRSRAGGSRWQSLMRGSRVTEADYLNGEIVLLARLHGSDAPVNDLVRRLVNQAAAGGSWPGDMSAAELLAAVEAAAVAP